MIKISLAIPSPGKWYTSCGHHDRPTERWKMRARRAAMKMFFFSVPLSRVWKTRKYCTPIAAQAEKNVGKVGDVGKNRVFIGHARATWSGDLQKNLGAVSHCWAIEWRKDSRISTILWRTFFPCERAARLKDVRKEEELSSGKRQCGDFSQGSWQWRRYDGKECGSVGLFWRINWGFFLLSL